MLERASCESCPRARQRVAGDGQLPSRHRYPATAPSRGGAAGGKTAAKKELQHPGSAAYARLWRYGESAYL